MFVFESLQTAIQDISYDVRAISTVLDSLNLTYKIRERLYSNSIEIWFQITDSDFDLDDILALVRLLSRVETNSTLTHNKNFLMLRFPLEY